VPANASRYFAEYAAFHTDDRNRVFHEIGIPLIVLSIFALLELVKIGRFDLGLVVGAALMLFYFSVDVRASLVALIALAALYYLARFLAWPWAIAAFVIGWVFQFAGHRYEGRNPAFFTNLIHLLIGPLWICSLVIRERDEKI